MISCPEPYAHFIRLAWPGAVVYEDELPLFHSGEKKVIFYSNLPLPDYAGENVSVVRKHTMDVKKDLIFFLKSVRPHLKTAVLDPLLDLPDDRFEAEMKLLLLIKRPVKKTEKQKEVSAFKVFQKLANGLSHTYPLVADHLDHRSKLLFSLMAMTGRIQRPPEEASENYLYVLKMNRNNYSRFADAMRVYLLSDRTRSDFLLLLGQCGVGGL